MKYVIWAVAIILSFFLGRVMYTPLGPALLAKKVPASAGEQSPTVVFGSGSRELRITIDLKSLSDREVPKTVELKKRTLVAAMDGSQETPLERGSTVTVKKVNGLNLEISAGGALTGFVPIRDTDFTERVAEYRAKNYFAAGGTGPGPLAPVVQAPEPGPNTPVVNPKPEPEPEPTPAPKPAPEPEPEPEPEPVATAMTEEQIIQAMQASVKGGAIKEFKFEQVQGWKAGEEETVDGENFQTGLAAYKAQTIFGEKTVQAKALIKEGKVVKWIYAKTGMEIR